MKSALWFSSQLHSSRQSPRNVEELLYIVRDSIFTISMQCSNTLTMPSSAKSSRLIAEPLSRTPSQKTGEQSGSTVNSPGS